MNKKLLSRLFGATLFFYIIIVPFFGMSVLVCLTPIILLDFFAANSFSWKIHNWTWQERIGDLISIAAVAVLGYARANIGLDNTCSLPLWSQYLVGIAVVDTFGYWVHYFAHGSNFLWKLHRVHHSRVNPNIWNASYEHFGDALFRLIAPGLILVLLGFDNQVIVAVSSLTALIGTVSHLNLNVSIPKPFVRLIVNPITHRIHHHKNEIAVNNGNIFHVWDHIMGTYALYEMNPDDYGLNPEQQISDSPVHIFFTTLK